MSSLRPNPYSRRRRWLWISLGGFFFGTVFVVSALLAPPLQGWLLRQVMAKQLGWRMAFDHIGIGPTGLDLRGLDFTMPGVSATSEPISIRVAPTQLLRKQELRLERVDARKIRLVITPAQLGPSAPFEGVLRLFHAPLPWALDGANLDGEIVVRDADQSRLTGNFSLCGGGVTPTAPGEFSYALSANSIILPPGLANRFSSAGTLRIFQTPTHGISRIALEGDLHFPPYGKLLLPPGRLKLNISTTATSENYTAHLSLGSATSLDLVATLDRQRSILTGHLKLGADQTSVVTLLGDHVPQTTLNGDLAFTFNLRNADLDVAILSDFDARAWQKLLPQLSAFEAFKGHLTVALKRRSDRITIENFHAAIRGEKSPAEADVTISKSFDPRILFARAADSTVRPLQKNSAAVDPLSTPLEARISLAHFPVEWINPFLTNTGVQVSPGEFSGAWTLGLDGLGKLTLEPTQLANIGPLSLTGAKAPTLPPLAISFLPSAKITSEEMTMTLAHFRAVSLTGPPLEVNLTPRFTLRGDRLAVKLADLSATEQSGNRLTGGVNLNAELASKNVAAELALEADLPSLPHSAETFGPVHASLRGKFHQIKPRIFAADALDLKLSNTSGELISLNAPQPFLFGLSDAGSIVMTTLAPLQVKLGRWPLAWLRPWSSTLDFDGTMAPIELKLSSVIDKYSVAATGPLQLEKLSVRRKGHELISDATATLDPGLDLLFLAIAGPTFQMAYSGTVQAQHAKVQIAGRDAIDFDLGLSFKGDGKHNLPDRLDLRSRVDFSAFPNRTELGLPIRGVLTTDANGDLLGGQPVDLSAELVGLPDPNSKGDLPSLGVTLRGKFSPEYILNGNVQFRYGTSPQPTDAAFDISLNLVGSALDITSAFHSHFIDGTALLALTRAFPKSAPKPAKIRIVKSVVSATSPHIASEPTLPFWGELRGSFDLDIGALQFAPYRIDHVNGRLDADGRTLILHNLGGEMFAGRWGGQLRVEHDPENSTGEHTLVGAFQIEQFESARVVQAVFPHQLALIDGRVDVHANVSSHGNSFIALIEQSTAAFTVTGKNGIVRLAVPKADLMSTAAVFGGTVLLSPELRALGRLLKKFAEMPVDQLLITGRREENGDVTLNEFRFDSPQARLLGHGRIEKENDEPLMKRPLQLSLDLAAKDELSVILGGMKLLEKKPRFDGFREMREPFVLGGRAGAPDTAPFYDLLAKAASGSKGTWGFLMRKIQARAQAQR